MLLAFAPALLLGACESWCNGWICDNGGCLDCGPEIGCPDKPPPPPAPPPVPSIPPWDANAPELSIEFRGEKGQILANGKKFYIKGVNWFGTEGRAGPPLGLDVHEACRGSSNSDIRHGVATRTATTP